MSVCYVLRVRFYNSNNNNGSINETEACVIPSIVALKRQIVDSVAMTLGLSGLNWNLPECQNVRNRLADGS